METSIQSYLGDSATFNQGVISFSLSDLQQIIEPGSQALVAVTEADAAIAILLVALHKTTAPIQGSEGTLLVDKGQAVVSQISLPSSTSVTRNGDKQIEHKINFNIYTADYNVFPIDRIV